MRTRDGGATWEEVAVGAPSTPLFCIDGNARGQVLVGGKGAFVASSDGGGTWQNPEFDKPVTYGWVHGLAALGDSPSWVTVGSNGGIYFGSRGDTWRRAEY